jgi:prepilin-type N-terminal cleavage/methylation domain-containing protein
MKINWGRGSTPQAGFSLLELMFALTVLAVGVLAAFSSQVGSVDLLRSTREQDAAMLQMRAALEALLALQHAAIPVEGSPFEAGVAIDGYNAHGLSDFVLVAEYPGYALGGDIPDPLEVVLTSTWRDFSQRERSLRLSTMVIR